MLLKKSLFAFYKLTFDLLKKNDYFYLILSLTVLSFAFLAKLGSIPIRIWDEARLANSALNMHLHGLSLIVRYDDLPDMWSTKPPMMIWLQAISMKLFGVSEWAVRFPAAMSSICTGLLIWHICKKELKSGLTAFLSVVVFSTTYAYIYIHAGRTGDYDALLVFCILSYSYSIYRFCETGSSKSLYTCGAFLIIACLTKGVAGLFFAPGLLIYLIYRKKLKQVLLSPAFYVDIAAFVLFVFGYYFFREKLNPGYLKAVWNNELGGRYLSSLEQHNHPFLYYISNMVEWRNPFWSLFVVPSFLIGFVLKNEQVRKLTMINAILVVPYLLIISTGKTKLEWYELPVYPFFAIQIGLAVFVCWKTLADTVFVHLNAFTRIASTLVLFISLSITPFLKIYNYIYHFQEQPWDVDSPKQGYFLQNAISSGTDLNGFVFCYQEYNAQIQFYTRKLQAAGTNIILQWDLQNIKPGQHVVVSQDNLKGECVARGFKKVSEQFGCTEYIAN